MSSTKKSLLNLPGFNVSVTTNRTEAVEAAANLAGKAAYTVTKAVVGRGWDDSAKTVDKVEELSIEATRAVNLAAHGIVLKGRETRQLADQAAAAIAADATRVVDATVARGRLQISHRVGEPTRKVITSAKRNRDEVLGSLKKRVNNYCDGPQAVPVPVEVVEALPAGN